MKSKNSSKIPRKGYLYVVLAAIFWAASGSAAKFLFNNGITAFQLSQLRITLSAASMCVWLLIRNPRLLRISPRDIFYFLLLGTFGMAAINFSYLFAISKIKVAAAILLQYLAPVFIALYSTIFLPRWHCETRRVLQSCHPSAPRIHLSDSTADATPLAGSPGGVVR